MLAVGAQISFAQKDLKQAVDQVIAEKGANIFMNIDKTLLEPKESARLSIGILVYSDNSIPGDAKRFRVRGYAIGN